MEKSGLLKLVKGWFEHCSYGRSYIIFVQDGLEESVAASQCATLPRKYVGLMLMSTSDTHANL